MKKKLLSSLLVSSLTLAPLAGCENLPGNSKEQGAVIGGVGGAAAGAAVASHNRGVGALIGGLLGAGGGYLIGTQVDKKKEDAQRAGEQARTNPATPEMARQSATADLNHDGFVTLDEVVAMKNAGLSDQEMVRRLQATNQVFQLTSTQEQYLRDHGVSQYVVDQMLSMNQTAAAPAPAPQTAPPDIGNQTISH